MTPSKVAARKHRLSNPSHLHAELAGDYVVYVNSRRLYIKVSDGVCQLLGYSRTELLAMTIDDLTPPELRGDVKPEFKRYEENSGLAGEYILLSKKGRRIPIRYEAVVFPDGCLAAKWEPLPRAIA